MSREWKDIACEATQELQKYLDCIRPDHRPNYGDIAYKLILEVKAKEEDDPKG